MQKHWTQRESGRLSIRFYRMITLKSHTSNSRRSMTKYTHALHLSWMISKQSECLKTQKVYLWRDYSFLKTILAKSTNSASTLNWLRKRPKRLSRMKSWRSLTDKIANPIYRENRRSPSRQMWFSGERKQLKLFRSSLASENPATRYPLMSQTTKKRSQVKARDRVRRECQRVGEAQKGEATHRNRLRHTHTADGKMLSKRENN